MSVAKPITARSNLQTMSLFQDAPIIAVWKPKGPSSFQIVRRIKETTGEKKVGHAGTLDPLAEGVLVIGIGRNGTKQLKEIVGQEKEYEAVIKLGEESSTDDEEGEKLKIETKEIPSLEVVKKAIKNFIGDIQQKPPPYSAVKIKGKRAYALARRGQPFILSSRSVFIKDIEILEYVWPILKIKVMTGPGVYIRSLARDLGKELKTGGYIANLIRTRIGKFTSANCYQIDNLE
jgi:tRNA pseudouridine55 synthase